MQFSGLLLIEKPQAVVAAFAGSLGGLIDAVRTRLLALLRDIYTIFDMPALKKISGMFQDALQHPGTRLLNDHLALIGLVASLIVGALAVGVLLRMLWAGIRIEKASFKTNEKSTAESIGSLKNAIVQYFKSLINLLGEGSMLFLGILALSLVLFIFIKMMWFSYLASPIGSFFPVYFPNRARLINMVVDQDLFGLPFILTMISFGSGMVVSAVCRFFHLTRYMYLPRGIVGRIILVALPLNLAAAAIMRPLFPHPHWGAAYAATLVPTLLSFAFCFRFTNRFLPELGMLGRGLRRKNSAPAQIIFLQNLNSHRTVLEFDPVSGRRTGKRFPAVDDVQTQGQWLARRGHEFFLYRYGRELFFKVDHLELRLEVGMSVKQLERGRFLRRFELFQGDTRLFRLSWSLFPLFGARKSTGEFFDTLENVLQNQESYESAFIIKEDDPELSENYLDDSNYVVAESGQ